MILKAKTTVTKTVIEDILLPPIVWGVFDVDDNNATLRALFVSEPAAHAWARERLYHVRQLELGA